MQLQKPFSLSGNFDLNADGTCVLALEGGYPTADHSKFKIKLEMSGDLVGLVADSQVNSAIVTLFGQAFNRAV